MHKLDGVGGGQAYMWAIFSLRISIFSIIFSMLGPGGFYF